MSKSPSPSKSKKPTPSEFTPGKTIVAPDLPMVIGAEPPVPSPNVPLVF
ncbi:hypothetical protein PXD56_16460 [Maribacter sp. SA7]|nr:hypothetical protein [Maribacter zhoushanensis]MDF4204566.1 hypothetical protein [Maribacter zhoushanensis]